MKDIRNTGTGIRNRRLTRYAFGLKLQSLIFLLYTLAIPVHAQPPAAQECSLKATADSVSQPPVGEEYKVKAGFIFNFAKFVEWSEEAFQDKTSPILLCVFPPDIFNSILFTQHIGGREILIKPYQDDEDVKCCHILFLSGSDRTQEKLNAVKDKKNILTVGESEDFNRMGGIINFVTEKERVNLFTEKKRLTFEINLNAANSAGLKLSSQLLRSARKVEKSQ